MTRLVKLSSRNWIGEKSLLMGSLLIEVEVEVEFEFEFEFELSGLMI
jgi:hypothetical protein